MKLALLVGGPEDGKVAEVGGSTPTFLLSAPRERSLLDRPECTARWDEMTEWYEVTTE